MDAASVLDDFQQECARVGGTWTGFSNGCADYCNPLSVPRCTQALVRSCECGPGRCALRLGESGKATCVDHPAWHRAF